MGNNNDRRRLTPAAKEKLALWQKRLSDSDTYWKPELDKMDRREALLQGDHQLKPLVVGDHNPDGSRKHTSHVRNIVFENIESQVSSAIPQPKVTARRKKDEKLATLIENFLRNELNRLPFEEMNDMNERTVPVQGGAGFLVEWDNAKRTHLTVGEAVVSTVHPKQFAPQPGVYTGIADMDWFITKKPTTKHTVLRQYGVDLDDQQESEPEIRGAGGQIASDDAVTMYVGYEKSRSGGINKYVWVNDVPLEDLEDYQARRQPVCRVCGRVRPLTGQVIATPLEAAAPDDTEERQQAQAAGHAFAGAMAQAYIDTQGEQTLADLPMERPRVREEVYSGGACPWCGCKEFEDKEQEYEQVILPIKTMSGLEIPGATFGFDEQGQPVMKPTRIPFYKPDVYPFVLQKSVSVYGQLLGSSDVDVIADQQNTINRLEQKIIERLIKAGTRITLPERADMRIDCEDGEKWYIKPDEKNCIDVYEFTGNLNYELTYLRMVYEESRQLLGITDSLQGRRDPTATSAVAKEFSASMAAGRQESKRVMKNAAYASLFEMMFKFQLAYSDEPRPISYRDHTGQMVYAEFNRYDFLEQDADGQYYWNDQFLFSCDTSAPLASNREAMWQETRLNLQTGAFGDPHKTETLILFWGKMEQLHYPGAGDTRTYLQQRLEAEKAAVPPMPPAGPAASGTQMPAAPISPAIGG